ncbi:hypothetical protein VTJ04DRAFT_9931 [Mycothermus thermophilus]|uniref:uncharacterized protein n=1 Tax=Humicola insolens TaxID=85995 RepID=UPI003742CCCE
MRQTTSWNNASVGLGHSASHAWRREEQKEGRQVHLSFAAILPRKLLDPATYTPVAIPSHRDAQRTTDTSTTELPHRRYVISCVFCSKPILAKLFLLIPIILDFFYFIFHMLFFFT